MNEKSAIVELLKSYWPKNKAKGLLAQAIFTNELSKGTFGKLAGDKILPGCWLVSPKEVDFYKFRFCFFIHPTVIKTSDVNNNIKEILSDKYRPFHAITEFMNDAGVGVIYVITTTRSGELPIGEMKDKRFENVSWVFFSFQNGEFISIDPLEFMSKWYGSRGRASRGNPWTPQTTAGISGLDNEILLELFLNELFYTGFLKETCKKPLSDPYDVDSFLVSISQKNIFPMEIKEKFPGQNRDEKFFGIDAGRIMMLLRICIPNDANAIYLIRELDESDNFIGWKYMTLSDIIMTSSWNLQAGGPGMGGQSTQTIRLPYDYFKNFNDEAISEDNLKKLGNLPTDAKELARVMSEEIASRFSYKQGNE